MKSRFNHEYENFQWYKPTFTSISYDTHAKASIKTVERNDQGANKSRRRHKQQKEEFQATSKKQNETKNGKQEPLLALSSREREIEREQSNKKEDIRFSRITSRGYKDTPELRLDYNFRWLRGSWGIVKVPETKGRKRLARTTCKERKTRDEISETFREREKWGGTIFFSLSLPFSWRL